MQNKHHSFLADATILVGTVLPQHITSITVNALLQARVPRHYQSWAWIIHSSTCLSILYMHDTWLHKTVMHKLIKVPHTAFTQGTNQCLPPKDRTCIAHYCTQKG